MTKYVAFLRGIGPSDERMRNDKLCGLFEKLGFTNCKGFISSGNVLFESSEKNEKKLEETIEKALPEHLGFSRAVMIRSKEDLEELVKLDPFKGMKHGKETYLNVTFLKDRKAKPKFKTPFTIPGQTTKIVREQDGIIFSVIDVTGNRSIDLMTWLEKTYTKQITTRTWNTVQRVLAKMK